MAFLYIPVHDSRGNVVHVPKRYEGPGDENGARSGHAVMVSVLEKSVGVEQDTRQDTRQDASGPVCNVIL